MKINFNASFNEPQNGFKGVAVVKRYVPKSSTVRNTRYAKEVSRRFCGMAGESFNRAETLISGLDNNRLSFLDRLIKNYNRRNFYQVSKLKEDASPIGRIVESVENPTARHLEIVSTTRGSLSSLEKIFKLAKDDKELEYVQDLQHGVLRGKSESTATIIDLLESKNAMKYAQDAETYNSYLKLNGGEKDAVKNLDNMVNNGTFSKEKYDIQAAVQNIMKNRAISSVMSGYEAALQSGYSKEGETLLRTLFKDFFLHKKEPSAQNIEEVINIYRTTTKENLDQRLDIIKKFKFSHLWQGKKYRAQEEISSMNELFTLADNNKEASHFIDKSLNKDLKTETIAELKEIVQTVDLSKARFFFSNIKRIISGTKGEERLMALRTQIDAPPFKPKDSKEKESLFTRIFNAIEYRINKFRYDLYTKKHA